LDFTNSVFLLFVVVVAGSLLFQVKLAGDRTRAVREMARDEKERLEAERERLAFTSELLAVAQRTLTEEQERLKVERERRQYHMEQRSAFWTIHQVVTEALINISARIELSPNERTIPLNREKMLTQAIQAYDQRLSLLKIKQGHFGSAMPIHELLEMQDIENQIERYTAEIEAMQDKQ